MAGISEIPVTPINFVWSPNYETEKIDFRMLTDIPMMHSCEETNTYVLGIGVIHSNPTDNSVAMINCNEEMLYDLHILKDTPLPYGQIAFFSYYAGGEFIMEATTEKFKPHLVEQAFESFGYKEVKLVGNYIAVSKKDEFKLKLQYGY